MNIAGRILDPLGPLAQLWQDALAAEAGKTGLEPTSVIELVRRAIALTGNASCCALVDRRKGLLAKVSSDSLDLIDDPELFVPDSPDLFGKKFKKAFLKDLKLSKELDSLVRGKYHGNANKQKPFRRQPGLQFPCSEQQPAQQVPVPSRESRESVPEPKEQKLTGTSPSLPLTLVSSLQKGQNLERCNRSVASSRLKIDFLTISEPPIFAGRLAQFLPNWRRVTLDPEILNMVVGYKLELTAPLVQHGIKAPLRFSLTESRKIEAEISDLLQKGALTKATPDSDQFVSSLFLVPKRDGDSRPVINLKDLNTYLQYNHFKMEGIHLLRDLMRPNDWLGKIDLKDAYFVIPIWENHRKYLRFLWKDFLLDFTCLPFGLAVAPRVFTKIMKPVVALLRRTGIRLIVYLDDLLFMNSSKTGLQ